MLNVDEADIETWIEGLLTRLRLRGGILHSFLDRYLAEHGRRWFIWGGGDRLAPKFPRGISAPAFFSSVASEDLDAITGSQTWVARWTHAALGLDGPGADRAVRDVLHELVAVGVLERRETTKGSLWGLPAPRIEMVDVGPDDPPSEVRCAVCAARHHAPPEDAARWLGRPCLRLRCLGRYTTSPAPPTNYYRRLYREGRIRRVVAAEHTGLLTRAQRQAVETGFKGGTAPDAPNVLAATPTLEMGIDIGDLSAVMLTAVPPSPTSYLQRVGRAGRRTGNAFVTTFAEGDPRSLYFLGDPELMMAGEIVPPNCFLDAIEILRRQYLAFLIDRAAEGSEGSLAAAGDMPRTIGEVASRGMAAGGWLRTILDAGRSPDRVTAFVRLFGAELDAGVAVRLAQWAAVDMGGHVERVLDRWRTGLATLANRRERLRERETALRGAGTLSPEDEETLGRIVAELRYVGRRLRDARQENALNALEALGLMPNYTLFDDSVTLEVSLWGPNERYDPNDPASRRFDAQSGEYVRPASLAIRELAPGNWFYVAAHRVRIDAVDNGTEHEPSHALWRMCPDCAWATTDATQPHTTCPRCGAAGVADQGARINVLPLRLVSSTEREATARASDDSDERQRELHDLRALVDIDPTDITGAWLHRDPGVIFGVEVARAATIRYLNLGLAPGRRPRPLRIGGAEAQASLFTVCRHCGGVMGIRGDGRDPADPAHHRAWCKVRSGARREAWDDLALVHELITEAVRILLPVAEFEHRERVASFKAALMLGLRDSFGGDPTHLRVVESDFPARGGDPADRNRFVVLHDTVPGGTGYLRRLASPDELRRILARARELISRCDCQTRGRPGCHRCLYGGIGRNELPHVSRSVALELLDEILIDWGLEEAPEGTITGVNLDPVIQSELERMFKVLLTRWAERGHARVASLPDPDAAWRRRFELRFQDGPTWEIREQVRLADHHTTPDFYATRLDAVDTAPVAIYLDGWRYHGGGSQIDDDARRRASLRASGVTVWTLTWPDVKQALEATNGGGTLASSTPIANAARNLATKGLITQLGAGHGLAHVLGYGAFEQLMERLRHPALADWRAVAVSVALAPVAGSSVDVASREVAVNDAIGGKAPEPSPTPTLVKAAGWESTGGLPAYAILDGEADPERACTVVLSLDTSEEVERERWVDWLHLGNLFAGLGSNAVITTTTGHDGDVAIVPPPPAATNPAGDPLAERLGESFDENARGLALAAAHAGHGDFIVGYEPDWQEGTLIEVAWPEQKIGLLPSGEPVPEDAHGWSLLRADRATSQELIAAFQGVPD